jgi:hypothetical protein
VPIFEGLKEFRIVFLDELRFTWRKTCMVAVMGADDLNLVHPYTLIGGRLTAGEGLKAKRENASAQSNGSVRYH